MNPLTPIPRDSQASPSAPSARDRPEDEAPRRDAYVRAAGLDPEEWIIMPRVEWGKHMGTSVSLLVERNRLRAQLPDGMEHCTIQFKECPEGHGWLTATNWVQHGCPTCERNRLRAALSDIHLKAHCLTKAGPLHTLTLDKAWGHFMKIGVMATAALAERKPVG